MVFIDRYLIYISGIIKIKKKMASNITLLLKWHQSDERVITYFLWFVFKNNDVIWLADKRWEMRSRAPIFNGTSHTENSHLWFSIIKYNKKIIVFT
jgi:hypothetical protein